MKQPEAETTYRPNGDNADPVRRALLSAATAMTLMTGAASGVQGVPTETVNAPAELAAAIKAYDRATVARDIKMLATLVADDYVLVNSDASVQNKASYLADFTLPGFKIDPYTVTQPVLKVWAGNAVSGGLMHLRWTQDGARHQRWLRVAHVWAKDRDRWQITYTQLTRLADGDAATAKPDTP